ncbi:uncharacterized protein LOC114365059 [Ostrinia furnacalis]|uniref:uncharacterized protein LOC114365059 n=1 Tax=Ostrinia furnacalis TaxID=93504 RepID=UPI00103F8389|nr:uncharacterized protein LOC114365059 [Ostrinia furnacalis]
MVAPPVIEFELSTNGNKDLIVENKGVENISPCAAGLVFFADVNNTADEDFNIEMTPDQCCLDTESEEDCEVVEMIGDCVETVPGGTTKTLKLVAPLIDLFERKGHCIVYLDSKPKNRQRGTMRDTVKISFDTRLKNIKQAMEVPDNVTLCKRIDEDPLNDCKPVDCESYYNGKRPYFDNKTKRCTDVPSCVSDSKDEVPNVILDLKKNKCIYGKAVSSKDLELIKELTSHKERKPKDILIIKNTKSQNPAVPMNYTFKQLYKSQDALSKISQLANEDFELRYDPSKLEAIKKKGLKFLMTKYFITNRLTLIAFGVVISIQCFLICMMIYCLSKKCGGCHKKKVIRKFFNYRQDASVTTPLICTSNIDTETTEFQYFSESSNIDKKIKCYKACQKERKNNVKMSMSDDILSKCLTRRDWSSKPAKSEAIPEITTEDEKLNRHDTIESIREPSYQNSSSQSRKQSSAKVNFENEKPHKPKPEKRHIVKSIVRKIDSRLRERREGKDYDEMQGETSEKEIKCHSYNYNMDANSNLTGFKPSTHSKKLGIFRSDKSKKGTVPSIERGAQAAFSNDSIDDFLSERGLIFLAGEDLSKYSFSSQSIEGKAASVSSEVSSKTSKNNVVKNVLSLLHRKSKHGPSSDPGVKKSSTNLDVELIHMSHASVYSSNNESDYLKSMKITKDSRSSL